MLEMAMGLIKRFIAFMSTIFGIVRSNGIRMSFLKYNFIAISKT